MTPAQFEMSVYPPTLLAPIRRSWTGSITAITQWLHYADHRLAPIRRSRTGSNMAVGDKPGLRR